MTMKENSRKDEDAQVWGALNSRHFSTAYSPSQNLAFIGQKTSQNREKLPSVGLWKTAAAIRERCRKQTHTSNTTQVAPGFVQANLVIVPKTYAYDFLRFCLVNPKSAPLLEATNAGDPVPRLTAPAADLRTDLPKYKVFVNNQILEVSDITSYWRDDLVSFLLGCSFSWEEELVKLGHPPLHITQGRNVPMYISNIPLTEVPPFSGNMVVSLRLYPKESVEAVRDVTARYPGAHGGPVHIGDPRLIGIKATPIQDTKGRTITWIFPAADYGDSTLLPEIDCTTGSACELVPMFWPCGVTPQAVLEKSKIPFYITHSPGHMFVTDLITEEIREPSPKI